MTIAKRTKRLALALWLAAAGVVCFAGEQSPPRQPGAAQPEIAAAQNVSLPELVAPPLAEAEEKLRMQLQPRIAADAQSAVARRTWRYLRPTDAVMLGLKKNLSLRLSGRLPLFAEQALLEARAVFDPVLQVTVSESQTSHAVRWITTQITRANFVQGACQAIPLPPGAATNGRPDVTQICFAVSSTQEVTGPAYAAAAPDEHPGKNEVLSTTVELTQRLPWGPVLKLVESSTYNQTYYLTGGSYFTYDKPWSSSLFAQLTLPLPGTKGFGPFSQGDFAIKLAEVNAQRSQWDVKAAINGILLQIDLAFWDLVESAENLAATMENSKLVESLAPRIERMYKQQAISQLDKSQMDAELARVRVEEELALRTYYGASTALAALVEDDAAGIAGQILFPAGYSSETGKGERPATLDEAQQASLKQRPELQVRKAELEVNKLAASFAENQARPEISVDVSTTLAQNASVIGYNSLADSLRRLKTPDRLSSGGALTYVAPLGLRAAKAAVKTADTNVLASEYAARISANEVIREVNDAFAAYSSALARVTEAEEALKLSEFAYQLVERRFEVGEYIGQVELNRNRRDVLGARASLISARIDVRRAWSRLLAAQGVLADRYPQMHAYNDFERHRLASLAANKALRFFFAGAAQDAARAQ